MFGDITQVTIFFLILAAFSAGLVDAIAGGGGLIQLPALLIGLPQASTVEVLGTNKVASIFGTSASALTYRRSVKTDAIFLATMALPAFFGSVLGALSASLIPTQSMRPIVFILLVAVAIYTWRKPDLGSIEILRHQKNKRFLISAVAGLVIGFYDIIFFVCLSMLQLMAVFFSFFFFFF